MSDWDYMMKMGYGNPDGTLTDEFFESCEEDSCEESNLHDIDYEYIDVELTPDKYLTSDNARYIRSRIINDKENVRWNDFELLHDKTNMYDPLAIQVFYNGVLIGYIKKNQSVHSSSEIDDFCFKDNKLRDVSIKWVEDTFEVRRKITEEIAIENEKKFIAEQEKQERIEQQEREREERESVLEQKRHEIEKQEERKREIEIKKANHIERLKALKYDNSRASKNGIDYGKFYKEKFDNDYTFDIDDDIKLLKKQPYGIYDINALKLSDKLINDLHIHARKYLERDVKYSDDFYIIKWGAIALIVIAIFSLLGK